MIKIEQTGRYEHTLVIGKLYVSVERRFSKWNPTINIFWWS